MLGASGVCYVEAVDHGCFTLQIRSR